MSQLTLGDLELLLGDLLGERRPLLLPTVAGKLYLPRLDQQLASIRRLPPELRRVPLATQLGLEDLLHDGLGGAIWHFCEAYRLHPTIAADLRQLAVELRQVFIPELVELRAAYADEAVNARRRAPELERRQAELARFPVAGGGTTLADWVRDFIGQGQKIDDLLGKRGELQALSKTDRGQVAGLRTSTIGLLGRLRTTLRDEIEGNPELDRNLEARIFGYHDELVRLRANQARSSRGGKEDDADAPAGGDGPSNGGAGAPQSPGSNA